MNRLAYYFVFAILVLLVWVASPYAGLLDRQGLVSITVVTPGHDYGTIATKGFRKLMVDKDGVPTMVDNPRWKG